MKQLIIIGASGHGKVAADIAEQTGYREILFLDDDVSVRSCKGYLVAGGVGEAEKYAGADFFVAIGDPQIRERIQEKIRVLGLHLAVLSHPAAILAKSASIGEGSILMAGAVVNPDTSIGRGCIVNTSSSVDHDCVLGDYVHIAVGSHIAGAVTIGDRTWIGAGAVVKNNITICKDCIIGAGAVVVKDIECPGTYVGVPVKKMKEERNSMNKNMPTCNKEGGG